MVLNVFQFFCDRKKSRKVNANGNGPSRNKLHGVVSVEGHKSTEDSWINQDSYVLNIVENHGVSIYTPNSTKDVSNLNSNRNRNTNTKKGMNTENTTSTNINTNKNTSTRTTSTRRASASTTDTNTNNEDNTIQTSIETKANSTVLAGQRSCTVAIFDGHGPSGHMISTYCSNRIIPILNMTTINHNVEKAFEHLQTELKDANHTLHEMASSSGATGTIVNIDRETKSIEAFNVGDSHAFVGFRVGNGKLKSHDLTIDHKPSCSDEAERISNAGGRIYSKVECNDKNGPEKNGGSGPPRVWYKCLKTNKNIGLAMTRSLGDWSAHLVGVSCKPAETKRYVCADDEFILVCSDGVTDVLSREEILIIIDNYMSSLPPDQHRYEWDPQKAADILVSLARKRWYRCSVNIDDITCCVIKMRDVHSHYFMNDKK